MAQKVVRRIAIVELTFEEPEGGSGDAELRPEWLAHVDGACELPRGAAGYLPARRRPRLDPACQGPHDHAGEPELKPLDSRVDTSVSTTTVVGSET